MVLDAEVVLREAKSPAFGLGIPMAEENFVTSREVASSMQQLIDEIDLDQLKTRGLVKFKEVGRDMCARTICLPSTLLMAIRHMTGDHSVSLADFYELGILTHINDRTTLSGDLEKGFPSFHSETLDTYLRYALEFAKIAGLYGGIVTHFDNLDFASIALQKGVVVLSVDNLFIPAVMNTDLDPSSFKPSRHAELIHGKSGENFILSDVTNFRNGRSWDTKNRSVGIGEIEKFVTCPRLNDPLTRAIVLTQNISDWEWIVKEINGLGIIETPKHNPILSPFFKKGIPHALDSVRTVANQGLSQWEMIGQTK